MIVPDVNLLIYAYDSDAPHHAKAKAWWERCLTATQPVGLPWVVLLGFLRLTTSRAVFSAPLLPAEAIEHIRTWLARPQVRILVPGPSHLDRIAELAEQAGQAGALTTDLHIAALALENAAELHANDSDFGRFPALRWVNPLRG